MEYVEFTGKTVDEAVTEALIKLGTTSDKLDYHVLEQGSSGILGIGRKPAKIEAKVKLSIEDVAREFLLKVFKAMNIEAQIDIKYSETDRNIDINLSGEEMGLLIGKRGQTIDSLQYLVSLVVNKESKEYLRVKVDTENYRNRRKATLEELAKNIAYKVKRTKRAVSLEPMNPYERRIIHSALQDDKYVTTKSEGEEPYRHIIVLLKK
ncbi:MAG: protein jag [Lachnospiraceae bacterium]|nr:protein jag [Lachnospiraceae bacterium]